MAMVDMVVMVMVVDTMARGRLKLSQDILEDMVDMDIVVMVMAMVMDMVDMAMDTDMERGKLMLPLDTIIMVMDMVDMAMDMVMDTMVKQYLFISFSKFCCIHWNLLESSQQKHRPLFKKNKNSFFEIKRTKLKKKK